MNLDDAYKSVKLNLYERAVSPLSGSFIIAWILWNYRFLLILFSEREVEEKFNLFDMLIFPNKIDFLLSSGLLYPLLTAIAFICIYPFPAHQAYKVSSYFSSELRKLREKYLDEALIPKMTFDRYVIESNKEQETLRDTLASKDAQLSKLREEIEGLNEIISDSRKQDYLKKSETVTESNVGTQPNQDKPVIEPKRIVDTHISKHEKNVLTYINEDQPVTEKEIKDFAGQRLDVWGKERVDWIIENLHKHNLIRFENDCYLATDLGRSVLESLHLESTGAKFLLDVEIENVLLSEDYRFFYNPDVSFNKAKNMSFEKYGIISLGQNENEQSWRAMNGYLEFLDSKGDVHNRFKYSNEHKVFISTGEESVGAFIKHKIRNQFLIAKLFERNAESIYNKIKNI